MLVGVKANSLHVVMNTGDQVKYSDKSSSPRICISGVKRASRATHGQ